MAALKLDDPEFNRIFEEGRAALKAERDAWKTNPRRPKDWEEITPEPLKPAIKHIRRQFELTKWQITVRIECGCYVALHPELACEPKIKGSPNLIPLKNRAAWQKRYQSVPEPQSFNFWANEFSTALEKEIAEPFNSCLQIAKSQKHLLCLPPVEWAKCLCSNLIYSLRWTVAHLIKDMCDEQDHSLELVDKSFDGYCSWVYWRAPRFVRMQPSGNTPYDPATAWNREDTETTYRLLRGLTERMLDPARFRLDRLAGEAHVALACEAPFPVAPDENQPATSAENDALNPLSNAASLALGNTSKLPNKKRDLSTYMDQARLTDRQQECLSLRLEYGLSVTEIADRLKISRKTVDEHIEAAKRKIDLSRTRSRQKSENSFRP